MVCVRRRPEGSDDAGYGSLPLAGYSTTIEEWVASKEKFVVAAASQVPVLSLSRVERLNSDLETVYQSRVLPHIPGILARHGILFGGCSLDRLAPYEDAYDAKEVLTIRTNDSNPREAWKSAVNDVLALTSQRLSGYQGSIIVQLEHAERVYDDVSSPIPDDSVLVKPLNEIKGRLIEVASTSLRGVWSSIVFHLRHSQDDFSAPFKPTVIVFCYPKSTCDFAAAEEKLLEVLNPLDFQVHLELLPGRVTLEHQGQPIRKRMKPSAQDLPERPENGSSIGVKGGDGEAGTLGGWLMLNLPREKTQIKCALTCYHVVRSSDASIAQLTDSQGVHRDSPQGHFEVQYPAALDAKPALSTLTRLCTHDPDNQQVHRQQQMVSRLMSGPSMGKVLFASGYQQHLGKHRLDWALIESPDTFSHNKPPPRFDGSGYTTPTEEPYNPHPDAKVRHFERLKKGGWVVKRGRTTLTSGVVNAVDAIVEWSPGVITEETEVLAEHTDFAADGDSGSFVIDARGRLVGLLFAVGRYHKRFNPGYVIPIDRIQDHVNEVTGGGFLSLD